jgi:hypothetical protein
MTERSPTFKDFNPTGNADVAAIKEMTDQIIDYVKRCGKDQRRVALAVTNYEQAAMWAVKSLFSEGEK